MKKFSTFSWQLTKPQKSIFEHIITQCNEVAAILLDNYIGGEWDIILHQQGGGLWHINNRQPVYDPLHFPLLLSHGELGLDLAVQKGDITTTTQFNVVSLLPTDCTSRPMGTHCCIALQHYFCDSFPLLMTEMLVPSLPRSLGTSRLVTFLNSAARVTSYL